jgi:acetyl-CoA carboxylase biotin carboxylase subunit
MRGHAIECRINAEDPALDFRPSPGVIARWQPPVGDGVRIDTHVAAGTTVTPFYDSLLAKVVVAAGDRPAAIARMRRALGDFEVQGVPTTISFHRRVLEHPDFVAGRVHTRWVEGNLPASGGPRE